MTSSDVPRSGGTELRSTTTARAIVKVRGQDVTYGLLRLTPDISSGVNGIDVNSYMIRSGNDAEQHLP